MIRIRALCLVGLIAVAAVQRSAATAPPAPRGGETVFFAFDDHGIPWKHNLKLTLVHAKKYPGNPVLRRGPKGAPDYGHAVIYGTVLKDGAKFRTWYLGMIQREYEHGQAPGWWRPMCYAESTDGIHWIKPDLGLVELHGNTHNNICRIEGEPNSLTRVNDFLSVLYDPDDPDPSRRYKTAYIAHVPYDDIPGGMSKIGVKEGRVGAFVCATSADGLRWKVVGDRPANAGGERFEVSSLYRFGRFYYATGQLISPWAWRPDGSDIGRVMLAYRSPDFASWSSATALAFARPGQLTNPPQEGQQTHMGAGLWNRGNVLVGLYGMWQDGPKERPTGSAPLYGVRIDLGLIVSNDGIHFREPVPNFKVIERGHEGQWDSIALLQGHAFAQVGDETYIWYSHWDCEERSRPMEIGLATLRRDGFGYLSRRQADAPGHCVTATVPAARDKRSVRVNVEGASAAHPLRVELLDAQDRPLAGYSGANAAKVVQSGTRQLVEWPAQADRLAPADTEFSIRASFPEAGDVRLYAVYVGS
jgi:hypothetical protein